MMEEDDIEVDYDYFSDDDDEYEDDMAQVNPDKFYEVMLDVIRASTGINFTLLMEKYVGDPSGYGRRTDVTIHPRWNQPCYGELRKYKSTHPDECTQPKNKKPGDLWHPFPDGTPVAVGTKFHFRPSEASDALLRFALSARSPWLSGIGDPLLVKKDGHIIGVLMRDTRIDPTVLVNLFNNLKSLLLVGDNPANFVTMVEGGFTEAAAIATILATGSPLRCIGAPDGYYTTKRLSLRRIVEQKSRDLTGGTLHDRFDYNRTELENVFMLDGKPTITFRDILSNRMTPNFVWTKDSQKDCVKYLLDAFNKVLESEPPQSKTRFDVPTGKCILINEEQKEAA